MDVGLDVARGLVTLVAVVTAIGGALADLIVPVTARQHFGNPNWPPHAKFHDGQTIALGALLGALAIGTVWFPGGNQGIQFQLAVITASFIWLSMLAASVLPGTRWIDPEFEEPNRRSRVGPQLRLALGLLVLLLVAEVVRFL